MIAKKQPAIRFNKYAGILQNQVAERCRFVGCEAGIAKDSFKNDVF